MKLQFQLDLPASLALRETTEALSSTEVIEAILLFGSQARGTATTTSDVDVIYLLRSTRSSHYNLFTPTTVSGVHLDVNLVTSTDLSLLISIPSWQYRLVDACIIFTTDPLRPKVVSWLNRVQAWINSPTARARRVAFLRDRVLRLVARAEEIGPGNFGGRAFCFALALERSLFILCELAGVVPFTDSNPLDTLARLDRGHAIPAVWPLARDKTDLDEASGANRWKALKEVLRSAMFATPTFVSCAATGADSADAALALPLECFDGEVLGRAFDDHEWAEEAALSWIYSALEPSGSVQPAQSNSVSLAKVVDRVPLSEKRRDGQRFEEYDPVRLRLKAIVPTGGCRLPRCTFCRLPELASKAVEIDWATVLSKKGRELREVAIYTDGSFFDEREISDESRSKIAERLRDLATPSVVVESLPQFATFDKVAKFVDQLGFKTKLTISVGIQSTNQVVRRIVLGTPTTEAAVERFFSLRPRLDFKIRVFLLYGKPLVTLDEDETDVLRSVKDLTPHLGDGDTITLNFLNVVRDTQVDLLERADLYHKRDMCRFREFVQRLTTDGHRFQILPGCIAVRTCSERDLADGHVCSNCLKWLTLTETHRKYIGRIKCSEPPGFNFELPWGIFSDFEDRCRFIQSQLSLGATPYQKPMPMEFPKCAAVNVEFGGTAGNY